MIIIMFIFLLFAFSVIVYARHVREAEHDQCLFSSPPRFLLLYVLQSVIDAMN